MKKEIYNSLEIEIVEIQLEEGYAQSGITGSDWSEGGTF